MAARRGGCAGADGEQGGQARRMRMGVVSMSLSVEWGARRSPGRPTGASGPPPGDAAFPASGAVKRAPRVRSREASLAALPRGTARTEPDAYVPHESLTWLRAGYRSAGDGQDQRHLVAVGERARAVDGGARDGDDGPAEGVRDAVVGRGQRRPAGRPRWRRRPAPACAAGRAPRAARRWRGPRRAPP